MRTIPALVIAVGLVASLAACGSSSSASGCTPPTSGDASSLVTATGDFGARTTADFPTPLITDGVEVSTLKKGKGEALTKGEYADYQVTVWDGSTGQYLDGTTFGKASALRGFVGGGEGFAAMLDCSTVGSRIAATAPFKNLFGDQDATSFGLEPTSTLVVIIDVVNGVPQKADGAKQLPQAGFPSVVTAPDGTPGVTIPDTTPPKKLEHTVLRAGSGKTVKKGETVVVQYEGISWGTTNSVFQNTWVSGVPVNIVAEPYDSSDGSGLFPGTSSAIIGQKVGSQVMVIVPPDESYPADSTASDGAEAGSTRVYVFDILDVLDF